MHFTHIDHLPSIIFGGLVADTVAQDGLLTMEAGEPSIKERRRRRQVPIPPGGVVGDYAPFYFAPRSPMMYSISHGNVPSFEGHHNDLIYLATTTQVLVDRGLTLLFSDRNAVLGYAKFGPEASSDQLVDWDLMQETWWHNTPEEPDRKERRMAECLVWKSVPFDCFPYIAAHGETQATKVNTILAQAGRNVAVGVRPDWYI